MSVYICICVSIYVCVYNLLQSFYSFKVKIYKLNKYHKSQRHKVLYITFQGERA